MKPLLIVGSYLSPYVRKVLVCLEIKGIAYEVDHIVPFFGDDRFSRLSPLRRIPVLVDGDLVLSDSSVICQYIEDKQPAPALLPADIRDRARARWLEEFADTRMGDVFIWRLFNQIAIRPSVWGEKGDRALVDRTLKEDVPAVLDYLEVRRRRRVFASAPCRWPTSPSPPSSAMPAGCAFRSMPRAGPAPPPGWRAPWPSPPSRSWPGSRTPCCARRSPSSALR